MGGLSVLDTINQISALSRDWLHVDRTEIDNNHPRAPNLVPQFSSIFLPYDLNKASRLQYQR